MYDFTVILETIITDVTGCYTYNLVPENRTWI